jgi:hypothetical protein
MAELAERGAGVEAWSEFQQQQKMIFFTILVLRSFAKATFSVFSVNFFLQFCRYLSIRKLTRFCTFLRRFLL